MSLDPEALRAEIVAHPWRTVMLAFAAGAYFALSEPGSRSARTLAGTLTSTAFVAARDSMFRRLRAHVRPTARA